MRAPILSFSLLCWGLATALPAQTAPLHVLDDPLFRGCPIAALGDLDGDGDVDVLRSDGGVALNDGGGRFLEGPAGTQYAGGHVRLADVTGDGLDDVLFVGGTSLLLMVNVSGAVFAPPTVIWTAVPATPGYLAVASFDVGDTDGDGRPDVVVVATTSNGGSANFVFMNSSSGFLPGVPLPPAFAGLTAIAALDVDGDGNDELVAAGRCVPVGCSPMVVSDVGPGGVVGATLATYPGRSFGARTDDLAQGEASCADLDGDGDRDLVASQLNRAVFLMSGGPSAPTAVGGRAADALLGTKAVAADIDGDADLDLIGLAATQPIRPATALNDGFGVFNPGPASPTTAIFAIGSPVLRVFDRDGDGDADLCVTVAATYGSSLSTTFVFDGAGGVFTLAATLTPIDRVKDVVACDLDADGDRDLLFATTTATGLGGPMFLAANLGGGVMAAPVGFGAAHLTHAFLRGDFDGDGSEDVLQLNGPPLYATTPTDDSVLYLAGATGPTAVPLPGVSGVFATVGDLNGDARDDVVIDGQVWFAGPGATFAAGPALPAPLAGLTSLGDVDGDGDRDLIEHGSIRRNAGGANFGAAEECGPSAFPAFAFQPFAEAPVVVDLDLDGDLDVLSGAVVYSNTTRQIARGAIPRPGRLASLDLYGTPNGAYWLFYALAPANVGLPPYGPVLIEPSTAQLAASGFFDAAGRSSITALVPPNPALVGLNLFWQALDGGTQHVTNRHVFTVYGY